MNKIRAAIDHSAEKGKEFNYNEVMGELVNLPFNEETEKLMIEILESNKDFQFHKNSDFPNTKSFEGMLKFVALQILVEKSPEKYSTDKTRYQIIKFIDENGIHKEININQRSYLYE